MTTVRLGIFAQSGRGPAPALSENQSAVAASLCRRTPEVCYSDSLHFFRIRMVGAALTLEDISGRLEEVRSRIDAAARRSNRLPEEVKLLAVSKSHPADL